MPVIACTACSYCTSNCPANINIPNIIKALNTEKLYPGDRRQGMFYNTQIKNGSGRAKDCIKCAQCESVCPQHLNIIDALKEASEIFDNRLPKIK